MKSFILAAFLTLLFSLSQSETQKRSIVNKFTKNPLFLKHFSGTGYSSTKSNRPHKINSGFSHSSNYNSDHVNNKHIPSNKEVIKSEPKVIIIKQFINNVKQDSVTTETTPTTETIPSNFPEELQTTKSVNFGVHAAAATDQGLLYLFKSLPYFDALPNFHQKLWPNQARNVKVNSIINEEKRYQFAVLPHYDYKPFKVQAQQTFPIEWVKSNNLAINAGHFGLGNNFKNANSFIIGNGVAASPISNLPLAVVPDIYSNKFNSYGQPVIAPLVTYI